MGKVIVVVSGKGGTGKTSLSARVASALPLMGRLLRGFDMPDAVLTGVETRSSAPVRIERGEDGCSNIAGLYPTGEGAGWAGGIMSAAVDGIRQAQRALASGAARGARS